MFSKSKRGLIVLFVIALSLLLSTVTNHAATSKINNKTYTHPGFYKTSLHRIFHGVDVSVWQGAINWKKSKKAGIDFAIIRCGYTTLKRFSMNPDSMFSTNLAKAKDAGVSLGVYYYASCTTKAEAKKEANYVISLLKNNNAELQMPVVMDYEFGSGRANNNYNYLVKKKGKKYARKVYTNNAKAFMNTIKASGYETMFYSYRVLVDSSFSPKNYRFNMSEINGDNQYRFWLAQYSKDTSYAGKMEIWQYSSTGKVNGMRGNIDRNFWYYPLAGVGTRNGTKNIRNADIELSGTKLKYDGNVKEPKVKVKYDGKTLKKGRDYTVSYMDNIDKGTATVLVHGKGNYSNEAFTTFTIGNRSNEKIIKSSDAFEGKDDEPETPGDLKELEYTGNIEKERLKLNWEASDKANRYLIKYKVNKADKWTKKYTKKTAYTIKGLKKNSIIAVRVYPQNKEKKKVKTGKAAGLKRVYMRTCNATAKMTSTSAIKVKWNKETDKKGKITYEVVRNDMGVSRDIIKAKKAKKTVPTEQGHCYEISAKPTIEVDGKKYYGLDVGKRSHFFTAKPELARKRSKKKGFAVRFKPVTDGKDVVYKISYSKYDTFKKAKVTEKKNGVKVVGKKKKSDVTYYVKCRPYKVLHDIKYYGLTSDVVKVKTE